LAHRSGAGLPRHWGLEHVGLSEGRQAEEGCAAEGGESGSAGVLWPSRPGQPQFGWEPPRVTKPSLGRNADGPPNGMDYAQLCNSGDNRIDELRLLGNGVVPATATRAFLSLIKEL
jgi:hypothetical protein